MKNFKLLLATTAILAITGSNVEAFEVEGDEGATISAKAVFVNTPIIASGDTIDFGVLLGAEDGDTVTIPLSGSATKTGYVTLLGGTSLGSFSISNADGYSSIDGVTAQTFSVHIPDITLSNDDGTCGRVSDFQASYGQSDTYYVDNEGNRATFIYIAGDKVESQHSLGATLYVTDSVTGLCSGDTTATIMYTADWTF